MREETQNANTPGLKNPFLRQGRPALRLNLNRKSEAADLPFDVAQAKKATDYETILAVRPL